MMKAFIGRAVLATALMTAIAGAAAAKDVKGSKDHPLVSRYEGAAIVGYIQEKFNEYTLLLGKTEGRKPGEHQVIEGAITKIRYQIDKERTTLEVFKNYEKALADAGFETLFTCKNEVCGGRDFNLTVVEYGDMSENQEDQRYLAAKLTRPEGTAYVSLYVVKAYSMGGAKQNAVFVQLNIIESTEMETDKVKVDADAIGKGLDTQGHIAIYGIHFDSGSDKLRPESDEALGEIASLMKSRADLSLLVVGHTDSEGQFNYNMELSHKRAASVVKALVETYGIAANRLQAEGVGYLSPVATNDSDPGRALNRRVELVKRPD